MDGVEKQPLIAKTRAHTVWINPVIRPGAKARQAQRNLSGAAEDLERALVSLCRGFGESHPETLEARALLSDIPR